MRHIRQALCVAAATAASGVLAAEAPPVAAPAASAAAAPAHPAAAPNCGLVAVGGSATIELESHHLLDVCPPSGRDFVEVATMAAWPDWNLSHQIRQRRYLIGANDSASPVNVLFLLDDGSRFELKLRPVDARTAQTATAPAAPKAVPAVSAASASGAGTAVATK